MTATSDVQSPGSGTIYEPATGAIAGTVRWTDPDDVPRIAAGLRAAQHEWEARGPQGRAKVLARFAVWLNDHRDEIETLLVRETGKSMVDAKAEVPLAILIISYVVKTMEKALAPDSRPAPMPLLSVKKITVHYRPRPVVGVIAPWNYPVANALMDAIGALAAGCAVLLKPSERTPLTAELLLRGWTDSGAPEVLALAQGAREISEAVIDNADFIQFTGSTATGRKVMERAARRLTPVSLELGGKDPMIVLEDADVELAANAAVWGAMFNAGQTCVSVERVYVLEPAYDAFVAAVVKAVQNLKVGAGEGYHLGAQIDASQVDITERHVNEAVAAGARALTGGKRPDGPGSFYPPTVLVDVDHSMACMTQETFGPTLPVMKVADEAEAIRLANDSMYGLSATVWSRDKERAQRVARQLDTGAVNINDFAANGFASEVPMGGWKQSGIGARGGGAHGIRKYCRPQVITSPLIPTLSSEPMWYPASRRRTAIALGMLRAAASHGLRRIGISPKRGDR